MISFNYETDFIIEDEKAMSAWISRTIVEEHFEEGEINYIFCDDDYLHKMNVDFLKHDTLTDIISFDYSVGNELHGDVYISVERVRDNSNDFTTTFGDELARVMIHGVLHYCGYKDKTDQEQALMTAKEDYYLAQRS
jgi:rRNA maturation RNase YbeY